MKKFVLATILSFSFILSNAQDSLKHFEFGATFMTLNSRHNPLFFTSRAPVEITDGLFFRYTKNRFGFRSQVHYSKNSSYDHRQKSLTDIIAIGYTNKNFEIGVGGQYSLLKKKDWLYTFVDLSYRNQFSVGYRYDSNGGINNFTNSMNGLNTSVGLGFKIKTFNNLYLSSELGYDSFYGNRKYSNTNMSTGATYKYNGIGKDLSPFLKLHLTYKFR